MSRKTRERLEALGRFAIILLCAWIAAYNLTYRDEINEKLTIANTHTQSVVMSE